MFHAPRMAFTPITYARDILEKRHSIKDYAEVCRVCKVLFAWAIRDSDVADLFVKNDNRFFRVIPDLVARNEISEEELLIFARINSMAVVEKFLTYTGLNKNLADKMRKEAAKAREKDELNSLELLMQRQDLRTVFAIAQNSKVTQKDDQNGVMVDGEFIAMLDRNTRNFNTKLCSVGASSKREIILLHPDDKLLKNVYIVLKNNLPKSSDPAKILALVKTLTRISFPNNKPDGFIENCQRKNKFVIHLGEFISEKQGVCRHHALLNCYLISRLIADGFLQGEVIHHRQNFPGSQAHTWTLYRDHKSGKIYSLDSLWNDLTCISDNPGVINQLYGDDVESVIKTMHFPHLNPKPPLYKERANLGLFQDSLPPKINDGQEILKKLQDFLTYLEDKYNYAKSRNGLDNKLETDHLNRMAAILEIKLAVLQYQRHKQPMELLNVLKKKSETFQSADPDHQYQYIQHGLSSIIADLEKLFLPAAAISPGMRKP